MAEDMTRKDTGTPTTVTPNATDGFDCASVNPIPSAECETLVALYNSTNGPNWADNSGWLTSAKEAHRKRIMRVHDEKY